MFSFYYQCFIQQCECFLPNSAIFTLTTNMSVDAYVLETPCLFAFTALMYSKLSKCFENCKHINWFLHSPTVRHTHCQVCTDTKTLGVGEKKHKCLVFNLLGFIFKFSWYCMSFKILHTCTALISVYCTGTSTEWSFNWWTWGGGWGTRPRTTTWQPLSASR